MAYLDAIAERVIIFDGAFGTYMQTQDLTAEDFGGPELEGCNEMLVLTRPDLVTQMHREFLALGVDAIETTTFGAFGPPLAEYDLADRAYEISTTAAKLARAAADEFSTPDKPRFVAGSIGPGTKMPTLGHISFADLRDAYAEMCRGLLDGGIDLFLIETQYDLLGAKAAIIAARQAMDDVGRQVPIQVQVTIENTGRMLVGTEIGAALTALEAMKIDVIGLNCATGPAEMSEHLRYLSQHSRIPISVLPNAGLPSVVDGKMHYDLGPEALADYLERFVNDLGINVIGGCCGTTPEHMAAVIERIGTKPAPKRNAAHDPGVASIYSHTPYDQTPSVLVVGERTNANGSKRFKTALLEADWDTATKMAVEQVKEGSHVLDVCVDFVGRDGTVDMEEIASRFATQSTVPLMIDSTEADVVETALQWIGGKAILNSVNLEDGSGPGTRLDRFLSLARDYGAAVVCTCIDEEGQARDRHWKLRAAKAIYELATEKYGIEPADLIFDPLALTLGTGMEESRGDGIETIEGIRLIKAELPGVHTILGLSNISFGLKPAARHALNSVFLHECQQAGLDAAIVHAARIMPLSRMPQEQIDVCLDLIYDRRRDDYDPLEALLEMFEDVSSATVEKEDRSGWSVEERLKARIIDGERNGLTEELDEALATGLPALSIVNDVLLEGMKVVGELFGSGEMQLPFVLQSAETMKAAVAHLEPHMEKVEGEETKGRIVLGTVAGDVHDIGKNLVDIILTNNGYEVHNLGIKVSLGDMVAKAQEIQAHAIGMSGLLVKSTLVMRDNLQELNERDLATDFPVLLGGAALNRTYVERDLRSSYNGRLFYGKDAFEGLSVMDRLGEMRRSGEDDPDFGRALGGRNLKRRERPEIDPSTIPARSPEAATDNPVFVPPHLGPQIVRGVAIDAIAEYLNETTLFRNQWQFRPEKGENDDDFKTRIRPQLRAELAKARADDLLVPQVVYGYFPANADGNDIIIWTDENRDTEETRFSFPRQSVEPWLCIADFVRSVESGEADYVAFQIVTMGHKVSERTAELFAENKYQDYLFLHGLGVEMAESLAEMWHHRIREEWGFVNEDGPTMLGLFRQQYRGGRYSWGYPACPDLEDNERVAKLLGADRLGIEVNEDTGYQYHPEQTTSAIVLHHPRAKYFVAR